MSNPPLDMAGVIADARVMLAALAASSWQECHIVTADTEIFIAKAGGGPNPMRQADAVPRDANRSAGRPITAPHVATLVDILPPGSAVGAGQSIATIEVLGSELPVAAPSAGVLVSVEARPGALLEYGTLLATMQS